MTREQMRKKVLEALERSAHLDGFTELLEGDSIHRYVVGLTDNKQWSVDLLVDQWSFYRMFFKNITLGGRVNSHGVKFVDIGTSVDDKEYALFLQARHNQESIRDYREETQVE